MQHEGIARSRWRQPHPPACPPRQVFLHAQAKLSEQGGLEQGRSAVVLRYYFGGPRGPDEVGAVGLPVLVVLKASRRGLRLVDPERCKSVVLLPLDDVLSGTNHRREVEKEKIKGGEGGSRLLLALVS